MPSLLTLGSESIIRASHRFCKVRRSVFLEWKITLQCDACPPSHQRSTSLRANGAGKTTFAREFLPKEVRVLRFLNADEIARGFSPFDPSAVAVKAGRLLLSEIRGCLAKRETFGLESTLSRKTYLRLLGQAKAGGYQIELHYLWVPTAALTVERVRQRVALGGHNVPAVDVRRRFRRSLEHFLDEYLPLADRWLVWDSRELPAKPLANSATHARDELRSLLGL